MPEPKRPTIAERLHAAVARVPAGGWAVGVSGGADSVAMLRLLAERSDLSLHVVHLDHETRGPASAADAVFVAELAGQLGLPCTIARRSRIETAGSALATNRSARFRSARLALFRQVVEASGAAGVILAHHADDQAETVLHRLLRGAGPTALAGMSWRAKVNQVHIVRPLLSINALDLRQYLRDIEQPWREDASNTSPQYLRNRLRPILRDDPSLRASLLHLAERCARLRRWMAAAAPRLPEQFQTAELADCPAPLAVRAVARWLVARGAGVDRIGPAVCERLLEMARDAASPPRRHFPGGLLVRRRRGIIFVEQPVT